MAYNIIYKQNGVPHDPDYVEEHIRKTYAELASIPRISKAQAVLVTGDGENNGLYIRLPDDAEFSKF